ncbi:hypothetical protein NEOLEDRAFT_1076547 [Neolentinus lepideus HHB14362 ss-1]|uniref:Uncharacterized protein n=1 Tax=Neolentinus lepideus HHB14362 ss-1 TaxID=1314782 RepID=A0A165NSI1_9AGAM|nr:hypothetical protein NEOLEDRAFT_1076547 [Neolentinus lepideus HHB14362 ss-1]
MPSQQLLNTLSLGLLTDSSVLSETGWILGLNQELLFWVPPIHRRGLFRPSNVAVISQLPTKLNFATFVHGKHWAECHNPM